MVTEFQLGSVIIRDGDSNGVIYYNTTADKYFDESGREITLSEADRRVRTESGFLMLDSIVVEDAIAGLQKLDESKNTQDPEKARLLFLQGMEFLGKANVKLVDDWETRAISNYRHVFSRVEDMRLDMERQLQMGRTQIPEKNPTRLSRAAIMGFASEPPWQETPWQENLGVGSRTGGGHGAGQGTAAVIVVLLVGAGILWRFLKKPDPDVIVPGLLPELVPDLGIEVDGGDVGRGVEEEDGDFSYPRASTAPGGSDDDDAPAPVEEPAPAEPAEGAEEGANIEEAVRVFEGALAAIFSGDQTAYARFKQAVEILVRDHGLMGRGQDTALSRVVERNAEGLDRLRKPTGTDREYPDLYLINIWIARRDELLAEIDATEDSAEILSLYKMLDPLLSDGDFDFQTALWGKIFVALSEARPPNIVAMAQHLCRVMPRDPELSDYGLPENEVTPLVAELLPGLILASEFDAAERLRDRYYEVYGHSVSDHVDADAGGLVKKFEAELHSAMDRGDYETAARFYVEMLITVYPHREMLRGTVYMDSHDMLQRFREEGVSPETMDRIDFLHRLFDDYFRDGIISLLADILNRLEGREIPEEEIPNHFMKLAATEAENHTKLAAHLYLIAEGLFEKNGDEAGVRRARDAREALETEALSAEDRAALDDELQRALGSFMTQGSGDEDL